MRIYNTLSKREEVLNLPKEVKLYVCGLTPYDRCHVGHARTYTFFDVLKRYLIKKGHRVYHIQNITDVDDKIIRRCLETGAEPKQLVHENHERALELFAKLHILPADLYPKVTEHIPEIIDLVKRLQEKGFAYETETGVYFEVAKFERYGKLSGQRLEEIKKGARVEIDETKKDAVDFALWKKKEELIVFESPWGRGRPGWHIECSAMALKYAGTVDIHGGAKDLIFPHHENEIAQSEAATGRQFARYWVHTGVLTVRGEKMSKSLGNFVTLEEALHKFSPNALRLFFLSAHYRSPLDYEEVKVAQMEESVERIFNCLGAIKEVEKEGVGREDKEFREETNSLVREFYAHIDNDFRTPEALASLFNLIRVINTHLDNGDKEQMLKLKADIEDMLWVLGLEYMEKDLPAALVEYAQHLGINARSREEALQKIIELRNRERKAKNYARADEIRAKLKEMGVLLEDKGEKTIWKMA